MNKKSLKIISLIFITLYFLLNLISCQEQIDEQKKEKRNENQIKKIYSVSIEGAITPATMDQLEKAIDKAERDGATALLIKLNTPGGLMHSMDEMCRKILNSKVPVITYVWPPGAYAGSAGVYIMYASHLAAMSPATNIGSATPVQIGGGKSDKKKGDKIPNEAGTDDATNLKRKLFNHAKAQIKSFAEFHGRNSRFAERTITHAANITSGQARRIKAIELIASSPQELLEKAHGRRVRMVTGYSRLNLKNAKIVDIKSDFRTNFLAFLTNPVIVNLLMMIGMLGIVAEIQYPGSVFPGVIGAICLILGLYAMQTLPVNYAGMGLMILGIVFFILEIKVISYGMLSVAGMVSLIIGSILLAQSGAELVWDTLALLIGTSTLITVIMFFLIYKAAQVHRKKPVSGIETILNELGTVEREINDKGGQILVQGELWSAQTRHPGKVFTKGTRVRITKREGIMVYVELADSAT